MHTRFVLACAMAALGVSASANNPAARSERRTTSARGFTSRALTRYAVPAGVGTEMRHVDFHIADGIVLAIERLRGDLIPVNSGGIPTFDLPKSFVLQIQSGRVAIDTLSLSVLLNRYVFGFAGSPLRSLHVGFKGSEVVQTGVLHKGIDLPFRIQASLALTPEGMIRLHPTSVRVKGIGVKGVMRVFGIHLQSLLKLPPGSGARVEGNDVILDANELLPPPKLRGRLTSVEIVDGRMVQTFGAGNPSGRALFREAARFPNYMYFRGGTLRFGKLTMSESDMAIVDEEPKTPFDFSLKNYNAQLVAGFSKSTPDLGLIVHMPDFNSLKK